MKPLLFLKEFREKCFCRTGAPPRLAQPAAFGARAALAADSRLDLRVFGPKAVRTSGVLARRSQVCGGGATCLPAAAYAAAPHLSQKASLIA